MSAENIICEICGNREEKRIIRAREMMFGYRDHFDYAECSGCRCLMLINVPGDIARYYPERYYSFQPLPDLKKEKSDSLAVRYLRYARTAYLLSGRNFAGWLAAKINPPQPLLATYLDWFKNYSVQLGSKILDIGCSRGRLLQELAWYGFKDLIGIDPFIQSDITYDIGVRIFKKKLRDMSGQFDVVMLNHSFEHMPQPQSVLESIAGILADKGFLLIRVPTVSSYAWKHYQQDWVQLDAPRHLFLYSLEGIEKLAQETGFIVKNIEYDSTEFQFLGSQQYIKDISLFDERSFYLNPEKSIFSKNDIQAFRAEASRLNKEKQGDQISVHLVKR